MSKSRWMNGCVLSLALTCATVAQAGEVPVNRRKSTADPAPHRWPSAALQGQLQLPPSPELIARKEFL